MKFCIISVSMECAGFAYRLEEEGNTVYVWNKDRYFNEVLTGFPNIKRFYASSTPLKDFIKRNIDAIFIFDGSEFGTLQSAMRKNGYRVVGSNEVGDRLEKDRIWGTQLAKKLGIRVPTSIEVKSIDDTIKYIKGRPRKYIVKQTDNLPKTLNWKASRDDSEDLIKHLLTIKGKYQHSLDGQIVVQDYIEGYEVAIAGWFNGADWIRQDGQILTEINFENKALLDGGHGLSTGEMGTGMYFQLGLNRMFLEMVHPLTPILAKTRYVGCVDANCIVNTNGIYLLEHTLRFGYPISDLYLELLNVPFGSFMSRLATGYTDGYMFDTDNKGIVLTLAFPTFPYETVNNVKESFYNEIIDFSRLTPEDMKHVHYSEVKKMTLGDYTNQIGIASSFGYALTITGKDKDISLANTKALRILERIIPSSKGFYRKDIGRATLERMGQPVVQQVLSPTT